MLRVMIVFWLVSSGTLVAQTPDASQLNIDRIFTGEEFRGERFAGVKWLAKGAYTRLKSSETHKGASDLVHVDPDGKTEVLIAADKLIPAGAKEPLSIQGYEFSKDRDLVLIYTNSVKVWRQNTRGDFWTYRISTGSLVKRGGDAKPSTLMFAKLSPDGTRVGYVLENDLFVETVDGMTITRLTSDGGPEVINGTFDWVYEEEFGCRDGWRWSPDGQQVAYWQLNTTGVPKYTLIDTTTAKYPILKSFAYPKTGERNSLCRVGVVPVAGGETNWIDVPGDTRTDYYIPRMEWAGNSKELILHRVNRLQNAIDLMMVNLTDRTLRTILTERDGAWVDLPDEPLEWIENGTAFLWMSERDGWQHIYRVSRDGANVERVTEGPFDVIQFVHLDEKSGSVYFIASPGTATQRFLYRATLDGKTKAERLTPASATGWHDYSFLPDGTAAMHTFSAFGQPPQIELVSIPDHKTIRTLAANEKLRETIAKLALSPVEFFQVDNGEGVKLDGWLMKPAKFDPVKKYPVIFHVYGEPAGQTVTDRWGGNNYLWHALLTQQGYVVISIDNRGTKCPRGRDWRKSVYRKIGTLASKEQAAAAQALLKDRPYLDASRVGVWGWSGGGSMTLNLLFRSPDLYRTGISVAPVPDMRLYDTIYQERYMGLPQENTEDYLNGSPITHAKGLKGNLLLIHGTGDDNCHYQGVEKLSNRLIELNKPFSMMAYPNRSHSINEGKNTSRHLYSHMTRYFLDNLPAGPR